MGKHIAPPFDWLNDDKSDDYTLAILTTGFAMGVAATFAAIKLIGKLTKK